MPNSKLFLLILSVSAIAVIAYYLGFMQGRGQFTESEILPEPPSADRQTPTKPMRPSDRGVACTMDAKICPDGSAVGRVPPSCEFAPCPSGGDK